MIRRARSDPDLISDPARSPRPPDRRHRPRTGVRRARHQLDLSAPPIDRSPRTEQETAVRDTNWTWSGLTGDHRPDREKGASRARHQLDL